MTEGTNITEEKLDQILFLGLIQNFQQLAWSGLGKIANPDAEEPKVDLQQAKWAIDMLGMLQRRTKGNIADEEERELAQVLYTLRMNYVEEAQQAQGASDGEADGADEPATDDSAAETSEEE